MDDCCKNCEYFTGWGENCNAIKGTCAGPDDDRCKSCTPCSDFKLKTEDKYVKLVLKDKNGKPLYEGCVFKYKKHKGYLLPSFVAKVVWWDAFAGYGYQTANDVLAGACTPFSAHDELREDFLNHIEIVEE